MSKRTIPSRLLVQVYVDGYAGERLPLARLVNEWQSCESPDWIKTTVAALRRGDSVRTGGGACPIFDYEPANPYSRTASLQDGVEAVEAIARGEW